MVLALGEQLYDRYQRHHMEMEGVVAGKKAEEKEAGV